MRARVAVTIEVLGVACALAVIGAAVTHGEFESMKTLFWMSAAAAFLLLTAGSALVEWSRARRVGTHVVRCGLAALAAIPLAFVAARGVVAIDVWMAKRYVASELAPRLEQHRASRGRYPAELRLWEHPPPDGPWLMRRFGYASDGRAYHLSVMDPGVCGRVTSYSSRTRQWTETYDPCWY